MSFVINLPARVANIIHDRDNIEMNSCMKYCILLINFVVCVVVSCANVGAKKNNHTIKTVRLIFCHLGDRNRFEMFDNLIIR